MAPRVPVVTPLASARSLGFACLLCVLPCAMPASAGAAPDPRLGSGSLDFFQGPVISSGRAIGLGGATIGVADGAEAHLENPAAFAFRHPAFGHDWFDWDVGLSYVRVLGNGVDMDQSGQGGTGRDAQATQGGFNLKFGRFGIGVHVVTQKCSLGVDASGGSVFGFEQTFGGIGLGYVFLDGDLTVGGVLSSGSARIGSGDLSKGVRLESGLSGGAYGLLWAPVGRPWRVGLTGRFPVRMTQDRAKDWSGLTVAQVGDVPIPAAIVLPWSVGLGGSWIWGPRPRNPRPSFGVMPLPPGAVNHDALPRPYLMASADVLVTGATADGIGAQAWLAGVYQRSGATPSLHARAGIESEIWDDRLVLRAGTYFEPSRFDDRVGRVHGAVGLDLRVTLGLKWRVGLYGDWAKGWSNTGLGLGFWH